MLHLPFAIAHLGVLLAVWTLVCARPVHALNAALYVGNNGNSNCAGSAFRSASGLDSGECFAIGGYGARVTCTDDGSVQQAALYESTSCDIVFISGSGLGDGVGCIPLTSPRTSVVMSTIVDCSAGGGSGGDSSPLSPGVVAGIAISCVFIGLVVIVGVSLHCYRTHKAAAFIATNTMHMQQQHPQQTYAPQAGPHTTYAQGGLAPPPGSMTTAVVLFALVCLSSVPGVVAISDPELTAAILAVGTVVFFSTGIVGFLLCCCPVVLVRFGRAFFAY